MDGDARDVTPEALNIPPWVPDAVSKAARALNPSTDAGKHAIAGSAVANCRLHPRRTIQEAADAVYRTVRDIHIQLGIVK
jgi:hypothetical protein